MSYEIKIKYFISIPNPNMLGDHYEYEFKGDEDFNLWLGDCLMRMNNYMRNTTLSAKIEIIKYCRNMRGWGLSEAKVFVEEFFPWLTAEWQIEKVFVEEFFPWLIEQMRED